MSSESGWMLYNCDESFYLRTIKDAHVLWRPLSDREGWACAGTSTQTLNSFTHCPCRHRYHNWLITASLSSFVSWRNTTFFSCYSKPIWLSFFHGPQKIFRKFRQCCLDPIDFHFIDKKSTFCWSKIRLFQL